MDTESGSLQALNVYFGALRSKFTQNGVSWGTQGYVGLSLMNILGALCQKAASSSSCLNSHGVILRFLGGSSSNSFTLNVHLCIFIVLIG